MNNLLDHFFGLPLKALHTLDALAVAYPRYIQVRELDNVCMACKFSNNLFMWKMTTEWFVQKVNILQLF